MSGIALVGDIGGTNFRLALSTDQGLDLNSVKTYKYGTSDTPASIIKTYLNECGSPEKITQGVFAVASPATDPANITFTNGPWKKKSVDFANAGVEATVLNDFAAITYSIRALQEKDCRYIAHGDDPFFPSVIFDNQDHQPTPARILESDPAHRFAVIGPGTGLGVSTGLVTKSGQFLVMGGEGGHGSFSPENQTELDVVTRLQDEEDIHVTQETFASGTGLPKVFNAYAHVTGKNFQVKEAAEITAYAREGTFKQKQCADWVLNLFSKTLGSCVSSTVLTTNARTVFIAGGVVPRLGRLFNHGSFMTAFHKNDLGTNNITENVPIMLVRHPQPGLLGAHAFHRLSQP